MFYTCSTQDHSAFPFAAPSGSASPPSYSAGRTKVTRAFASALTAFTCQNGQVNVGETRKHNKGMIA